MKHVRCEGDPFQKGVAQGEQAREEILRSLDVLRSAEAFKLLKPWGLPMGWFLALARRKADARLRPDVERLQPDLARRMAGIAAGSGMPESFLYLGLSVELLMAQVDFRVAGCSAAGVAPPRASEPILVKNFDYPEIFRPLAISRHHRAGGEKHAFESLDVGVGPLAGTHDGMNEHGLVVCYNYGYGRGESAALVPITLLCQDLLERCRTTAEAVERVRVSKWAGAALLLLGDAGGDLRSVELAPGRMAVRGPENGCVLNTNHYQCEDLLSIDLPHEAFYGDRSVSALRGVRVHQSSERRLERLRQLLSAGRGVLARTDLEAAFRDHGPAAGGGAGGPVASGAASTGSDDTLCRHGPYYTTTCSVLFLPRQRRMFVVDGHPCDAEVRELHFDGAPRGNVASVPEPAVGAAAEAPR
ncbi:MAG: hypothetical protein HYZ53_17055 [Planctomycetes bacterium]|nr:hypothetical protein [Planctomycetota bacterium]